MDLTGQFNKGKRYTNNITKQGKTTHNTKNKTIKSTQDRTKTRQKQRQGKETNNDKNPTMYSNAK